MGVTFGRRTVVAEKGSSPVRDSGPAGTGWFFMSAEHPHDGGALSAFRYRYSGTGPFLEWICVTFRSGGGQLRTGPLPPLGEQAYGRWEFGGDLPCDSWEVSTVPPPPGE